jgi:hypothetical protein
MHYKCFNNEGGRRLRRYRGPSSSAFVCLLRLFRSSRFSRKTSGKRRNRGCTTHNYRHLGTVWALGMGHTVSNLIRNCNCLFEKVTTIDSNISIMGNQIYTNNSVAHPHLHYPTAVFIYSCIVCLAACLPCTRVA